MRIFSHIHLFLRHHHLPLTDVTWLLLTTQLLLTASSEEVWIPPRASGHGQARCPNKAGVPRGQSTRYHTVLSIKTIEATTKRRQRVYTVAQHFSWTTYAIWSESFSSRSCSREGDESIPSSSFELRLHPSLSLSIFLPFYISNAKKGPQAALCRSSA